MRKAFTLIELLVVIAIIAILAAILFPVFAQAKAAAKGAASISNVKQITLGALMYCGDADDTFMPVNGYTDGNFVGYYTWIWSTYPYMKSAELFQDPAGPQIGVYPGRKFINQVSLTATYGYNYTVLSPFVGADPGVDVPVPISQTALGSPANTVAFAPRYESASESLIGNNGYYSYGAFGPDTDGIIDPPDCANAPAWCFDNWGVGSFWGDPGFAGIKTFEAGKFTGGVAFRTAGKSNVAFADGSVRKMSPGALAAGTTWSMTQPSASVIVNDVDKYLWDNK